MKVYKNTLKYSMTFLTLEPKVFGPGELDEFRSRIDSHCYISNAAKRISEIMVDVEEMSVEVLK